MSKMFMEHLLYSRFFMVVLFILAHLSRLYDGISKKDGHRHINTFNQYEDILLSFARDFANVTVTTYFVAYLRSVISCSIFHGIV